MTNRKHGKSGAKKTTAKNTKTEISGQEKIMGENSNPSQATLSGLNKYAIVQTGFRSVLDEAHRMVDNNQSSVDMTIKLGGLALFYKKDSDTVRAFVNYLMSKYPEVKEAVFGQASEINKIDANTTVVTIEA